MTRKPAQPGIGLSRIKAVLCHFEPAMENGIRVLDAADSYGDSEGVIGHCLKTVMPEKRLITVTKVAVFIPARVLNPSLR